MPSFLDRTNFQANLRFLCTHRKSASAVARATDINRQQFEKYLSGKTFPSGGVRRRLSQHFGISIDELTCDPLVLEANYRDQMTDAPSFAHRLPQSDALELSALRNYLGSYQTFFLNPAWPGKICVGLVFVQEKDRQINTVFFNRTRDPETGALHRSRLDGFIVLKGERLFLLEKSRGNEDRMSETILFPSHRHRGKYLTGMSFGVTWRPHRMPFASRTIWRRVHPSQSVRTSISHCGIYQPNVQSMDPIVRNFFSSDLYAYTMTGS